MGFSSPVDQLSVLRSADTFAPNLSVLNDAVFAQAQQFSGSRLLGNVEVVKTTVDTLGNRYTIGTFSGTVDFDPSLAGIKVLASEGSGDSLFISKLDSNGNFVWAKSMGGDSYDYASGIKIDASGNIYTTGSFRGTIDIDPSLTGTTNLVSAGGTDIFISKLDSSGNLVWAKSMGGTGDDSSRDLAIDVSGNVYTTGSFQGTVDFDPSLAGATNLTSGGSDDIFISKLNSSGNFVWAKSMGGANSDVATGLAIDLTGNVYTTGYFASISVDFDPSLTGTANLVSAGDHDIFISKLDNSGNFVWAKSIGGEGYDIATRIVTDSSGNIYTCGAFSGTADFDPNLTGTSILTADRSPDIFISKLDSRGNFVWAKSMSGGETDNALGLAVDASGNVYTSGYFDGTVDFDPSPTVTNNLVGLGRGDIFISKLNNSGDFVWAKRIGGGNRDGATDLAIDSSGNVYTAGIFQDTVDFDPSLTGTANLVNGGLFLSKLTTDGNFAQAQQFNSGFLGNISQTVVDTLGNRYTVGIFSGTVDVDPSSTGMTNLTSEGENDIFISKLDSSGNFVWAKSLGGKGLDNVIGLGIDGSGNVYTTGTFQGTVDFDPSLTGTSNLVSLGFSDIFINKLDSRGNFVWAKSLGETGYKNLTGVAIDAGGNIYTTGSFSGTVDFDPSSTGTANLVSSETQRTFTSKLDSNGNFVWAKLMGGGDYYSTATSRIAVDGSGNVYTTGSFQGTAAIPNSKCYEELTVGGTDSP
jgi:Beta-propeller repeat